VGAGASSLAFADEVIFGGSNKEVSIIMVDMKANPGGHWNDAYDFVSLHQPASYYGVNSIPLGEGGNDLVSKFQLLAYFEQVIRKLEKTGRFKFYSQCVFEGEGNFVSLLDTNIRYEVEIRESLVDASYLTTRVPSNTPPSYKVEPDITLVPINGITKISNSWEKFVIIGGGKTGIDAVLRLLWQGVDPDKIVWIIPNDSWLTVRESLFVENVTPTIDAYLKIMIEAKTPGEFYRKTEKVGFMMKLDDKVWPTKQKCATVSLPEIEELRKVKNIIRQGRVLKIEKDKLVFEDGSISNTNPKWLHVDCTADGLTSKEPVPIFQDRKIVLQTVKMCQIVCSAAMIAAVENIGHSKNIQWKNEILQPVPYPNYPLDYFICELKTMKNEENFAKNGPGTMWLLKSRLNYISLVGVWGFLKFGLWSYFNGEMIEAKMSKWIKEGSQDCKI